MLLKPMRIEPAMRIADPRGADRGPTVTTSVSNWQFRISSILLVLATALYLPWVLLNLNWKAPWLAVPFAVASLMTSVMNVLAVVNHWTIRVPQERPVADGADTERI